MKSFCLRMYIFCLRSLGMYGILVSVASAGALAVGFSKGFHIGPLVLSTSIALAISLAMAISKLTPSWLADPAGMIKAFVIFVGSGPLVLLFGIVSMTVVLPMELDASLGKSLSILIALPAWALGVGLGWTALIYGILPDKSQPGPSPLPGAAPPPPPTTSADLRSLRQSRMSR